MIKIEPHPHHLHVHVSDCDPLEYVRELAQSKVRPLWDIVSIINSSDSPPQDVVLEAVAKYKSVFEQAKQQVNVHVDVFHL